MERELRDGNPQQFDVLTMDAFSGDAVPVHLITMEALAIYLRELKPDGVIAFNITNGYLDLRPVLWELARHFNLRGAWVHDVATSRMYAPSDWVLLAHNDHVLGQPDIAAHLRSLDSGREVRLWTDDFSNLFQILK
jgi:spermidine synthase